MEPIDGRVDDIETVIGRANRALAEAQLSRAAKHAWESREETMKRHGERCECPVCSPLWYVDIDEGGEA